MSLGRDPLQEPALKALTMQSKSGLPYMVRPRLACEPVPYLVPRPRMQAQFRPRCFIQRSDAPEPKLEPKNRVFG